MKFYVYLCAMIFAFGSSLIGCSNEPSVENYYTFKGQMMSEFLQTTPQFSEYAQIVKRAGLMDLLSAYGAYTCFAPTNDAVDSYLSSRGLKTLDDLSDEECDTIARTHLVNYIYSTGEMYDGVLTSPNMNKRYLEISHEIDQDSNAVVCVNKNANVIFKMQDDSVENGIVQPVNSVLTSSTRMLPDLMEKNSRIKLFVQALRATHLRDSLFLYKDDNYNAKKWNRLNYTTANSSETATVPDEHLYGFTAFCETDSIFALHNIRTLEDLQNYAKNIYDATYPGDAGKYDDDLTNRKNPLNRFIAYHLLNRTGYWNYLTVRDNLTVETTLIDPTEWYETMCPHTMVKVEKLTVNKYVGSGTKGELYLNRRYDSFHQIEGCHLERSVENDFEQQAANGIYYYLNDILSFNQQTRDIVQNCRMRMDVTTFFPELMTNSIRMNGDYTKWERENDLSGKYGRNYYFPGGYLKNVTIRGNGQFVYRRPNWWYSCYEGDEMNIVGNYDITIQLPPVPVEGDYQIRLGYPCEPSRGIGQIYFDGEPKGIPLDMTKDLTDPSVGADYSKPWETFIDEEKKEERKALKNKGYYRGPVGMMHPNGHTSFADDHVIVRLVLCTVHITPEKSHTLRFRNVSNSSSMEFVLDWFEIVPKSVYGISDEGETEDDL